VIYLGTQTTEWAGEVRQRAQLRIGFELADEFRDDGSPLLVSRTYTYSWHRNAALRTDLEGWCGRITADDFDLATLVRKVAILGIRHDEGTHGLYAYVASILPMPAGKSNKVRVINPPTVITPTDFDIEVFNAQPDWLRDKLKAAPEYRAALRGGEIPPDRHIERLQQALLNDATESPPKTRLGHDIDDEVPF
jgi:hypothetical protein